MSRSRMSLEQLAAAELAVADPEIRVLFEPSEDDEEFEDGGVLTYSLDDLETLADGGVAVSGERGLVTSHCYSTVPRNRVLQERGVLTRPVGPSME